MKSGLCLKDTPPNRRPSSEEVRAKKREVARRYGRGPKNRAGLQRRLREYHIEVHARYVGAAETEDFDRWLIVYRDHLLKWEDKVQALIGFADKLGQKLSKAHALRIIKSIAPRRWNADSIGKYLGVTYAVRQKLRIWTIGCKDVDKAGREKLRKEHNREAHERARRMAGIPSRSASLSRTQPWKAEGMSRRTWYRKNKSRIGTVGTNTSAVLYNSTGDRVVPVERKREFEGEPPARSAAMRPKPSKRRDALAGCDQDGLRRKIA